MSKLQSCTLSAAFALALALGGAQGAMAADHEAESAIDLSMHQDDGMMGGDDGPEHHQRGEMAEPMCPKGGMMQGHRMMGAGGHGMMQGHGMMGAGHGAAHHHGFPALLSLDQVKTRMGEAIEGNKRLKVSKVEAGGDFTAKVEIATVDGSLVHLLLVDRRNGEAWEAE